MSHYLTLSGDMFLNSFRNMQVAGLIVSESSHGVSGGDDFPQHPPSAPEWGKSAEGLFFGPVGNLTNHACRLLR